MAGLTDAGFSAPTQAEVEADIRADIAASTALGADVNTDPESPLGQITVIMAAALADLWSETQGVWGGLSVLSASGAALDGHASNYDITRHPAVASQVTLTLTGTGGTTVPAGSVVTDPSGNRWVSLNAAAVGSLGTVDTTFEAEETGAIAASASTTWTIATPVSGWTSATNAADATLGRDVETDAALRARTLSAVRGGSPVSVDGMRAAVLAVTNVTECVVIENATNWTDADGRPAKSLEVVVRNGADTDIAPVIWSRKPAGIELTTTVGVSNQVSESVTDASGASQTVTFSRPDEVDVYVEVDYEPLPTAPTNVATTIQQAILDFGESLTLDTGGVWPPNVENAIHDAFTGSVFKQLVLRMGLTASPGSAVAVPTSRTEIAVFDSSRITITRL